MELSEILNELLKKLELNPSQFAKKIGKDRAQSVYDLLSGKTRVLSRKMEDSIIKAFPKININWLRTGEGEMFRGEAGSVTQVADGGVLSGQVVNVGRASGTMNNVHIPAAEVEYDAEGRVIKTRYPAAQKIIRPNGEVEIDVAAPLSGAQAGAGELWKEIQALRQENAELKGENRVLREMNGLLINGKGER